MTTITPADIRFQVDQALDAGEYADAFDRDEIVRDIIREYGLVDTDEIPHDAFWAIVARHALPLEEAQ